MRGEKARREKSILENVGFGKCHRRPPEITSGLQNRKAPTQTCAMRTGSFHQPTSLLSIRDARPPAHTTHQFQAAARWKNARCL
jgi:hypothetical protein